MRLTMTMSSSPLPLPFSFPQPHTRSYVNHNNSSLLPHGDKQWTATAKEGYPNPQQTLSHPKSKITTIRYRLSQLCREGRPQIARQMFDTIPHPTTALWNTIIIGFVCNNMPYEAISFYSVMKHASRSSPCDPYTYSSTLKACADAKQLRIGKALHSHILRSNIHSNKTVYNSLLNMYATCLSSSKDISCCDLVKRVFDNMRKRNVVSWNIIISWYAKTKRFSEAVRHFTMLLRMQIKPTVVSFVNVFPAISGIGDANCADSLYGLLLKLGAEYTNDLFVISSAIFMYCELGCLHFARSIFDSSVEKNTEVWNSMISGYTQNDRPFEALDVFLQALQAQETVLLDDVTFLSAITATSQAQLLGFAQQLHAYLIKSSFISHIILLNAVIAMYSRCNCINDSFRVFIGMKERDVVSWNTMVSALVQNGMDEEGLMLVYEMQKQMFKLDAVTFTALFSAASNLRDVKIGKQTHAYLLRHNIQIEGIETYLIDMYAKFSMITAAQKIFEATSTNDRDHATWNAIIAANTQNGLTEQSFTVFRQMLGQNVIPNAVTLASLLPACSHSGSIEMGKQIHGFAIRNFLEENVFVSSALVDMYSKSGAILSAEKVFAKSPQKNSVTYTNMILGYGQHGMGERAITLFRLLPDFGVKPDPITLVAVLTACSHSGLVNEGLQIFESMQSQYGIQPSQEHFACVVDMLGRVGRVVEAYHLVKEVDEKGNMPGIWGSLLSACKIHKNFDLGKIVANRLLEMEGGNRITGYHVLLSNIYAEERNWESVNTVRRGMRKKGLTKEIGCSWIDILGCSNCFVSRERKHHQCDEIHEMLEKLAANMNDAGYRPSFETLEDWVSKLGE